MRRFTLLALTYLSTLNIIFSQISDLGRFEVNVTDGCVPLEIQIIDENVDSAVTVIQYDFNYSTSNNVFNPSEYSIIDMNSALSPSFSDVSFVITRTSFYYLC